MIHSIKFSNVGPFLEEAFLDLTWNKKDGIDDTIATNLASEVNVSKIMAIVGPNASGKSSILRVIDFLRFWIVDAWNLPIDVPVSRDIPNRLLPFIYTSNDLSKIECVFETSKNQYRLYLVIKGGFALEESISIRTKTEKNITWKTLFTRENLGEVERQLMRKNASILFMKQLLMDEYGKDIIAYWRRVYSKVGPLGTLNTQNFDFNRVQALNKYNQDVSSRTFLNELLSKFDTGLSGINFRPIKNPDGTEGFEAFGEIKRNNVKLQMPFFSEGTLKIVDFAYMIHEVSSKGGVLLFDEIDTSFHPEIVDSILELFLSKRYNKNNAQIILTTHNPRILKSLHKYQIQLVEKNKNGESETYRLDDVEGVRSDENYYAKYMAGAYGAKPNIETIDTYDEK